MARASKGNTVRIHYQGSLEDGTVFDTSYEREPLECTIGNDQLFPHFEKQVIGMEPGESRTILIPVSQAYGPRDPAKLIEVDRSYFSEGMEFQPGTWLQGTPPGGQPVEFMIVAVEDSKVTLDKNHPLAGHDLTFLVVLLKII